VTYSYTQISQYMSCPRRYKHRYLDGWKEKDTRAAMLFGRAFEQAVAAYFQRRDAAAVLYREWAACRDSVLHYSERDSWDRMLQSGVQLLDRFAQDDRVRIRQPRRNLQVKFNKVLTGQNDFVAYIDAIGDLDGTRCLLELKTTASRYPEEPAGQLALDPQLVCYSWVTGIADVAQVVLCASGWSRFSTSGRLSATNSVKSSATSFKIQSAGSKQPSSCPPVASASLRTHAPVVPTSDSVWDDRT